MPVVYRAADIAEAEIVALWLADQGIDAFVKDRFAAGTLQTSLMIAPRGIEVFVQNEEIAPRARQLLADRQALARDRKSHEPEAAIDASCDECGRVSTYPSSQHNTVQSCPHCGEYVDVP